jgi:hypothetical protein
MSANSSIIDNLNAPYNTIVPQEWKPNKEDEKNILNRSLTRDYVSGVLNDADSREQLAKSIISQETSEFNNKELVNLVNGYLSGRLETSDNRNDMITQTESYDPLKQLVKDYLKDNVSMYDNRGKYFDPYLFNQKFDEYIEKKNKERLLKEKVKLNELNEVENIRINPYDLPLNQLLINLKDTWFDMYDNAISGRKIINPEDPNQTDSFFYIGVTLIVVALLYIVLSYIFD